MDRWTVNEVSLAELSIQVRATADGITGLAVSRPEGTGGATWWMMGRIMSFSSWPRMWQCHTYSHPKLTLALTLKALFTLPVAGSIPEIAGETTPSGIVGSRERTLSGSGKGTTGVMGCRATRMSSSGFIRTVSFQPASLASIARIEPSQPTRLMT